MACYYLDATALVKRYSPEIGTAKVNDLIAPSNNTIIIGEVASLELYHVLNKKFRLNEITRDDLYTSVYTFELDIHQGIFQFLPLDHQILKNSKILTLKYGSLRGYQAVHLAMILSLSVLKPTMVATDGTLLSICREEGLKIFDPFKETSA